MRPQAEVMGAVTLLACVVLSAALLVAEPPTRNAALPVPDPEREGRELAARLRTSMPAQDSEFKGMLVITTRDGKVTEVPITSRITVSPTNWQAVYHAADHGQTPAETLTITHSPDGPNTYRLSIKSNAPASSVIVGVLRGAELTRLFAGSDFWALDLGLEFFHWPQQRKLRHEMRRSRSCNVLESVNPKPENGAYARVISWIDVETSGIIQAEAYDKDNKLVKFFKLGSLGKVEGQYQLESMKIRSRKTEQETEMKFDLPKKQ